VPGLRGLGARPGQRRPADVQVCTDEAEVTEHFAVMAHDNHNFAKFNKDQPGLGR